MNILVNNPSYKDPSLGGKTNKQINNLFIDGFHPMGLRMLVKDLGTESLHENHIQTQYFIYWYAVNNASTMSPRKFNFNKFSCLRPEITISDGGKREIPSLNNVLRHTVSVPLRKVFLINMTNVGCYIQNSICQFYIKVKN